jgi:hypothetical protein
MNKRADWYEAIVNTFSGTLISFIVTQVYCYVLNINMDLLHNAGLVTILTIVSVVRNYIIRVYFRKAEVANE